MLKTCRQSLTAVIHEKVKALHQRARVAQGCKQARHMVDTVEYQQCYVPFFDIVVPVDEPTCRRLARTIRHHDGRKSASCARRDAASRAASMRAARNAPEMPRGAKVVERVGVPAAASSSARKRRLPLRPSGGFRFVPLRFRFFSA